MPWACREALTFQRRSGFDHKKIHRPAQSQKIADITLDFARKGSVCRAMKREVAEATEFACIELTSSTVGEPNAMATAARRCAEAGQSEQAFRIALDLEPLLHEADSPLQAVTVIRRQIGPP